MRLTKLWLAALSCCAVVVLSGCVTVGPNTRPKPKIGPQPRDAKADVMLLNIGPASDTDGDTIPDTFSASTHMFDERYQLPVRVQGAITFTVMTADDRDPIHSWEFTADDIAKHVFIAQVGPVYRFRLQIPIDAPPVQERFVTIQSVFRDSSGHVTQAWHRDLPWMSVGG